MALAGGRQLPILKKLDRSHLLFGRTWDLFLWISDSDAREGVTSVGEKWNKIVGLINQLGIRLDHDSVVANARTLPSCDRFELASDLCAWASH